MAPDEDRQGNPDPVGTESVRAPSIEELDEENPLNNPARPQVDDDVLDPNLDDEEELRRERGPTSR
jgi:hypothetical protein